MVTIEDLTFEPYISKEEIQHSISKIAKEINNEYRDCKEKPTFFITLSGALFFAADLLRELDFSPKIGFIKCSSYGSGTTSSGIIKMKIEPTLDVKGKDLIVLEDIIDTGLTWKYLKEHLENLGAKRVRIATMLEKENPENIHGDWVGYHVGSDFLVGMGLDYAETGRNLPLIYRTTKI